MNFAPPFSSIPAPALNFPDFAKVFAPATEKRVAIPLPVSHGEKTRVLIADSDPVASLFFFQYLAQAGYEAVMLDNGDNAVAELRKNDHPPIAILDCAMPGMNSAEICRRMRSVEKVVYLILCGDNADAAMCSEAGADTVLRKPIMEEELLDRISIGLRVVEKRRAQMAAQMAKVEDRGEADLELQAAAC